MSRIWGALLIGAGLAWSGWEGGQSQSSSAAHWSVLATLAVVLAAGLAAGRGRQASTVGRWVAGPLDLRRHLAEEPATVLGAVIWTVLASAVIGWDLYSFAEERHDLPTLSRIFGDLTGHWAGRSAVFALWLALGVALAVGWRRPR